MANFVVIKGKHGDDRINLDQVRTITDEGDGRFTLQFDLRHLMTLDQENSRRVMIEVNKVQKAEAVV